MGLYTVKVELGRIVRLNGSDKVYAIVDIVDLRRVILARPNEPRIVARVQDIQLTALRIVRMPRAARNKKLSAMWAAFEVDSKVSKQAWSQKLARRTKKASLTDFERFQVQLAKRVRNRAAREELTKLRKAKA
eukprot:NODE_1441_length_540_cov_68.784114_g1364_i0.p2 GENE.NODE_1441_length_540_cov_68.784114_g1364_i0~~NODE_1441_length_540_cov_68.784114_g1364_i0.p2  ORF type:complete len:133 (+),score=26.30 NODE_1441_length_540_cov_68.784114_g1364_i0:48-446(+)